MRTTVKSLDILVAARDLLSETGENPEYDRGVANLVADTVGVPGDPDEVLALLRGLENP